MARYRLLVGFLNNDPAYKAIVTYDGDTDMVLNKAKEISSDFQLLSSRGLTYTETLVIDHHRDLFEHVIDPEELNRQLEHYRKPTRESPPPVLTKKKKTESDEEAKPFKIGRSSMITRMKSRIW